jgi:hypothetical protein
MLTIFSVSPLFTLHHLSVHLNLQSRLPDGRQVYSFIRPGTEAGLLLSMIKELPHREEDDVPLSRIHVFSTRDESMSLNMFVYGNEENDPKNTTTATTTDATTAATTTTVASSHMELVGADMLSYAQDLQLGRFADEPGHPAPNPMFERASLLEFIDKCSEAYVRGAEPRRFLKHMELFDSVSGSEGMQVHIEVCYAMLRWFALSI